MAGMRFFGVCGWLVLAGAAVVALSAAAERQPYERYQSIVDRQMFGPLPVGFDPTKSPTEVSKSGGAAEKELTKEQEKVKSAVKFTVINVTPDGETAIGFTDNSDPKAPKHYYLKVGESRGGWEVKEADAKTATMTIAKDDIEVSLSLGGDSATDGKAQATQSAAAASQPSSRRSPMLSTLGSRRRMRKEMEEAARLDDAKREAAAKAREEEERMRREEERAQREAERDEQRRQLNQMMEELKKVREERQSREKEKASDSGEDAQTE